MATKRATAVTPEAIGNVRCAKPQTGDEYLESLRDGRESLHLRRARRGRHLASGVPQYRAHDRAPLRRAARPRAARQALADRRHRAAGARRTATSGAEDGRGIRSRRRDAIAEWQRITYGWMGRSPDYKAAFLATLGGNAEFYAPFEANAKRWYRSARSACRSSTTRSFIRRWIATSAPARRAAATSACTSSKETDARHLRLSGAKVVATGSALTHYTFVAHHGLIPMKDKKFALVFMVPTNAPGVKFICRASSR